MDVLVIEPGHGSVWLTNAQFVRADGEPSSRGRYVRGMAWTYDGGWNMPDDYLGQYEVMTFPRKLILKVDRR
jgi:hypothetical protein